MGLLRRIRGSALGRKEAVEQFDLASRYYSLATGDRNANLLRAIECYTRALQFFTAEAFPADYATTQNNLGLAYAEVPAGDRVGNMAQAIACYTEALRFRNAETDPSGCAVTQHNLGNAYFQLPAGDRAGNLARAIGCYTEALRFYTAESAPSAYAVMQNNLGAAYFQLPAGGRAGNLARAIACYTEALRFRTAEASPLDYAMTQHNLGAAYALMPTGDRAADLARAIGCYTEALRFRTAEATPLDYAMTQHNLGIAYTEVPTGDRAADLERAIGCFAEALRFRTAETAPAEYAATQHNLGNAHAEIPTGDRAADLARAIACYTEALRFRTAEAAPLDYASTQYNLGSSYTELPSGDQAANLEQAIRCFTEALRFRTAATTPAEYAATRHNLGNAYSQLPTGDRAANLARAISCYTEALLVYTADAAPLDYASTQLNLGITYAGLPTGDRAANVARAIGCYTEALRFYTAESRSADYALTQHNLGNAYFELPTGDQAADLARAIGCYTEALRFRTAEAAPFEYAATQNCLGATYAELLTGDRAANLARAIACYDEALRFYSADAIPLEYAITRHNMAFAYASLPTGDRPANLAQAITCFAEALRFRTAEAVPAECRLTAGCLGDVHFSLGMWAEAHAAYSTAIRAGELLYQATGYESGRQAELWQAGNLVAVDAYSLARLGRLAEAAERLEAGRARALGEALARDQAALRQASEADRAAFAAAARRIRFLESRARYGQDAAKAPEGGSFAEKSAELVRARRDLAGVIDRIRAYLPGFGGGGSAYPEIAAAASPERPLAYLLATAQGSLALLVPAGPRAPAPEHAVWLDGLTDERLGEILEGDAPDDVRGGYLTALMTGDPGQLSAAVAMSLEVASRAILGPLAGRLAELGVAAVTIIPVGRLSLLPLSAAAPEDCIVALAPSARALKAARHGLGERTGHGSVLLAAGNPLPLPAGCGRLDYAGVEIRAIQQFFAPQSRRILSEDAATAEAVINSVPGISHLHLACHGGFDLSEPLDSALYLSGRDRLTLRDLLDGRLDLSSPQIAVLSACQTGITEFERVPDEIIGLPAGFLQAGIPGVVATLWPVNDRSTAVLMAEFYHQLLGGGKDPATALHLARRHLRDATARRLAEWFESRFADSGGTDLAAYEAAADYRSHPGLEDRPHADPVYWAGFAYSGP